jgi:cell division septal protein FtsQ
LAERRLIRGWFARSRFRHPLQVIGVLVIAALLWAAAPRVLRELEFFRIRRVEIAGVHYLAPVKVMAALGLDARSSVFDNLDPATRGIRSLPGVHSATVSRRFPGTLEVVVQEAVPVALAPRGAGMALLDSSGQLLPFDPAEAAPDLPIAASIDRVVARVLAAVRDYEPGLFDQVQTARRIHGDVALDLDGRRLWFGPAPTAEDIRAVMAVVQDLARRGRAYEELDGRYAGQVIVRRTGA